MIDHRVRVHRSSERLERPDQLAWKIAAVASDPVEVLPEVAKMVVNRVIDNAGVAVASLRRAPVAAARDQAVRHPAPPGRAGSTVFGLAPQVRASPEWAAWANGVAVRELDFHDTFLAAEYSHPGDNIPPIVAVAQHLGLGGRELIRGIVTGYEIQVALVRGICLHQHRIDHIAHLGPSAAAGLGTLIGLPTEVVYQAVAQALHTTTTTRQSRKGQISSWKAYAPAFAGKVAIEAVDRAMRGQGAPSPAYEGEDGFVAWLLDGPDARYVVSLPGPGEARRAILDTYTKEHSAEYQSQALIDLARRLRPRLGDLSRAKRITIHTSHHTHQVIGSGAGDPQKYSPTASRETLDHSIPTSSPWRCRTATGTTNAPTPRSGPPARTPWSCGKRSSRSKTRSGRAATMRPTRRRRRSAAGSSSNWTTARPSSTRSRSPTPTRSAPGRPEYIAKFRRLAKGVISTEEQDRFLDVATRLPELAPDELGGLTLVPEWPLGAGETAGLF